MSLGIFVTVSAAFVAAYLALEYLEAMWRS